MKITNSNNKISNMLKRNKNNINYKLRVVIIANITRKTHISDTTKITNDNNDYEQEHKTNKQITYNTKSNNTHIHNIYK